MNLTKKQIDNVSTIWENVTTPNTNVSKFIKFASENHFSKKRIDSVGKSGGVSFYPERAVNRDKFDGLVGVSSKWITLDEKDKLRIILEHFDIITILKEWVSEVPTIKELFDAMADFPEFLNIVD